jgi:hypothetical protein
MEAMPPVALEGALGVQQGLQSRLEEADRLRQKQVERARYEAELAERRSLRVDPANRLVADALEADWNERLRVLAETQQEYERQRQADRGVLKEERRAQIFALANHFPRLWRDPQTPDRQRQRRVRLLLEDVTLIKDRQVTAQVRFRGGASRTLTLPIPLNAGRVRKTPPQVVVESDRLLHHPTDAEIPRLLNQGGLVSGTGQAFDSRNVARLRRRYRLNSRYDLLPAAGLLTLQERAKRLGASPCAVKARRDHGLLRAHVYNEKKECLYEDLGQDMPIKQQGPNLSLGRRFPEVLSNRAHEVQYET